MIGGSSRNYWVFWPPALQLLNFPSQQQQEQVPRPAVHFEYPPSHQLRIAPHRLRAPRAVPDGDAPSSQDTGNGPKPEVIFMRRCYMMAGLFSVTTAIMAMILSKALPLEADLVLPGFICGVVSLFVLHVRESCWREHDPGSPGTQPSGRVPRPSGCLRRDCDLLFCWSLAAQDRSPRRGSHIAPGLRLRGGLHLRADHVCLHEQEDLPTVVLHLFGHYGDSHSSVPCSGGSRQAVQASRLRVRYLRRHSLSALSVVLHSLLLPHLDTQVVSISGPMVSSGGWTLSQRLELKCGNSDGI
nr:uncharacterized protein LOC108019235 isoform X1 [Drosophila suzukii]